MHFNEFISFCCTHFENTFYTTLLTSIAKREYIKDETQEQHPSCQPFYRKEHSPDAFVTKQASMRVVTVLKWRHDIFRITSLKKKEKGMKKVLSGILCGAAALFISQCSMPETASPTSTGETKSVKIAIIAPLEFDTIMESAVCRVSSWDMTTIEQPLYYNSPYISGIISKIPVGYSRHFEVFIYGYDGEIAYSGDAWADIRSRDTTLVTIVLGKPFGTAIINGWIEDYYPGYDEVLDTPATPWIQSTDITDTGVALNLMTTKCYSSRGDSIIYRWDMYNDTTWVGTKTLEPYCSLAIRKDGTWLCVVTVICLKHTDLSVQSQILTIFKEGNTISTAPNETDFEPPQIYKSWADTVNLTLGDTLDFSGATAFDGVDGDVSDRIVASGNIVWNRVGQFDLILTCSDNAGNTAVDSTVVAIRRR